MTKPKFCVFCGNIPESKNREHILPQWLLSLTGDPKRVVRLGYNFKTQRKVEFSWSSLVVPACEECNTQYSYLEAEVKPIIEAVLRRENIPTSKYLILLDWLDKVRVGLWLNYHLIQGNPTQIEPKFFINQRLKTKDRFLAIYPFSRQPQGLNAYGVETPLFHRTPSAFALRINDVLILNASSDYMFAGRCGLPSPSKMEITLDGETAGLLSCSEYKLTRRLETKILEYEIFKPSIFLLQPITPAGSDGILPVLLAGERSAVDPYVSDFLVGDHHEGVGKLIEQHPNYARKIDNNSETIIFQPIQGTDSASAGQLAVQTYQLQTWLQKKITATATDKAQLNHWTEAENILININNLYSEHYLNQARRMG